MKLIRLTMLVFVGWLVPFLLLSNAAHAQTATCDQIQAQINNAIRPGICQVIGTGNACYGSNKLNTSLKPGSGMFTNPGNKVKILNLNSMSTIAPSGVGLMLANTNLGPVKIIVFGNTTTTALSGSTFTMQRSANGQLTCEKTPSGMMLQSPNGQKATVVVNGVTIELGSTIFVSTQSDLLFDQDPRVNRRDGSSNPDANLCSGFDSDCNFEGCAVGRRLVYGPYCAENHPNGGIEPGAFRVTLYGQGNVYAGATDYEASGHQRFSFGRNSFNLRRGVPASYTFCYPGADAGSIAWEAIVESRSRNARIDWITVEYLGRDCSTAQQRSSRDPNEMLITTIDGFANISSPVGDAGVGQGQQVSFQYNGFDPVSMSEVTNADEIMESPLINWLTFDPSGLPEISTGGTTVPVARFVQVGLTSNSSGGSESTGLVGQVDAFLPTAGNGTNANRGIATVNFRVYNEQGTLVHEQTEQNFPFCMFADTNGACNPFLFANSGGHWPNGQPLEPGLHQIDIVATGSDGSTTATSTTIYLDPPLGDQEGPQIGDIAINPEPTTDSDGSQSVCREQEIFFSAPISDPSGVRSATLYYQLTSNGSTVTERTPIEMSPDNGTYYASGVNVGDIVSNQSLENWPDTLSYLIVADDELGNQSESNEYYLNLANCAGVR